MPISLPVLFDWVLLDEEPKGFEPNAEVWFVALDPNAEFWLVDPLPNADWVVADDPKGELVWAELPKAPPKMKSYNKNGLEGQFSNWIFELERFFNF